MTVKLMEHQRAGVNFLISERQGLLAFEQGLGKTLVAISAYCMLRDGDDADQMLVVCPNSLKRNWRSEIRKFAPGIAVDIAEGAPKQRRLTFATSAANVIVTSYETARVEVTAILALVGRSRTVLVLDESHAAKNWESLTSSSMRQLAPRCNYRWLLSGTPITNTPADLYTQIEIIAPGQHSLGSLESFLARVQEDPTAKFAKPILDRLVLRRTKEECLDLPEKAFTDVIVELPEWQRRLYDDMKSEMVCAIRSMSGQEYRAFASTALAQLTRLAQLASNPSLLFPNADGTPGKFEVLDGMVSDILSVPGRKIIIWSTFVRNIKKLVDRFSKYGSVAIFGGIPAGNRLRVAASFQNDPETRILIANAAAAGTGFTLTAASYVIYESMSWRYDHYAQSQDRNHRIGQTRPVSYLRLVAADTIDEAVLHALERKSDMARGLLSDPGVRHVLSRFTPAEMCALISDNRLPE